jgi:uncharacterized protein CbrC (UPF0167 family)
MGLHGPGVRRRGAERLVLPWCIADGSAAESHDAEFTDVGVGVPDDVPAEVVETIARRTPGFTAWQQARWLYHCGDGAAFFGLAGWKELQQHPDALDMLRRDADDYGWSPADLDRYLESLDKDGEPTAYLFRCTRCGTHLAYSDFS